MIMKKYLAGFVLVALSITCAFGVFAADPLPPPTQSEKNPITGANQLSSDAFNIKIRTGKALAHAKKLAGENHPYVILAEAHHKRARELTFSHYDGIYHSLRARELACKVIEEKGERLKPEYLLNDMERRYSHFSPSGDELDRRLDPAKIDQAQLDARYIICRTAVVLTDAQRIPGRKFGLAQAIAHQQKARELFMNQAYRDGIYHSLRARILAFRIIEENGEKLRPEFFLEEKERRYSKDSPDDDELDGRLDRRRIGRDEDAVYTRIELDI